MKAYQRMFSTVTTQKAKMLHYSLQTKDYTLMDVDNLKDFFTKANQFSY